MLSDRSETFDNDGLNGSPINTRQLRVLVDNNEFDTRRLPRHPTCEEDPEQEKGTFDSDDALGSSSFSANVMESQCDGDGAHSERFHAAPGTRTPFAQSAQATRILMESSEQVGGRSKRERPLHPPSIIISDSAIDKVADGFPRNLSESCSSTPSHTSLEGIQGTAMQHTSTLMAPFPRDTYPRNLNGSPTNYELATQDRQRPDIPTEIEYPSQSSAADSLRAFCNDADSTMTNDTAALFLATDSLHVKRRRLSREHPGFQTPANGIRSSKHRQKPMFNPPNSSAVQISTYPTPTLSFENPSTYQHSESLCSKEDTLSDQTPLSYNDPNEPLSPASLSPSISLKTDDSITRCLECPDVSFEGPNRKNSLHRHQRDHHNGRLRLECPVSECTVTFAPGRKDNRLRHVRATHPEVPLSASTTKRKRKSSSD